MSLAIVHTRAQSGISSPRVTVEVHLSNGLPGLSMVGLPETAVKESKDRVRSAILNSHLDFPARRITVNLAPADLPKEGGRYDLAIALGILAASEQIPAEGLADCEFLGELALSGALRPVRGVLPAAIACGEEGHRLVVPAGNGEEAALCGHTASYAADSLLEVCAHLHGRADLQETQRQEPAALESYPDLADVRAQSQAKRALEIAAAGGHNLLLYGPPGTGKTMLASRLPGILPPLPEAEALEAAAVQSVSRGRICRHWRQRPFRAPHHTASAVALVGGGSIPRPGEISLAHRGVLFLDELPEFQRQVLEVLREPLESGEIWISRASGQVQFPARFQLIAAMNPCPCGYLGEENRDCRCTPDQIQRYRQKISGPLLDRFDLHIPVNPVDPARFQSGPAEESSNSVRQRVIDTRRRQDLRQGKSNAQLGGEELTEHCQLTTEQNNLLSHAMETLGLSARAYHRSLRVARTIADMAGEDRIATYHLTEALAYRNLDRQTAVTMATGF